MGQTCEPNRSSGNTHGNCAASRRSRKSGSGHLSHSSLGGHKFRRQAAIPPFIVDFFCPAKGLIVEVDGETHAHEVDAKRDALLARRGLPTIRFTNGEVMSNMDGVLLVILQTLADLPERRWGGSNSPTPTPPLKGRG